MTCVPMNRIACCLASTILLLAGTAAAQSTLFVKIEDLTPSGEGAYEGADIDAIELLSPEGTAAFYAGDVVDSRKPANANNAKVSPRDALGQPVLADSGAPYVFSPNGGWIVVRIDLKGATYSDEWRLSVYEVDGSLYALRGGPEPYRVSIAAAAEGPWRVLGIGSGTARWTLNGVPSVSFDDERFSRIEDALELALDVDPITEAQYGMIEGSIDRLNQIDDIEQLQAELIGFHTYFEYVEHVVNDHGEKDGGRVHIARLLLETAWGRYRSITGA